MNEPERQPRSSGEGRPRRPGAVIAWQHRLSTRLGLALLFLALAGFAALMVAQALVQREMEHQLARSSAILGEAIHSMTQDAMLAGRGVHGYQALTAIGGIDGITHLRVLDKSGLIAFSTAAEELGTRVDKHSAACVSCHDLPQPRSRASPNARMRIEEVGERRVLSMVTPIYNARSCATGACHVHPLGRQVLGLLDIGVSMAEADQEVALFRHRLFGITAVGVVVAALVLYFVGRVEVLDPLNALVEGTRRVARDELDVEIRVAAHGEMGVLAASFNDMTRSLRRLEDELTALMASLESQVEARTADLRHAQVQLVRSEKLSSLGKLSASIAHEINNPLAGILTFAKLITRTLSEGTPDEPRRQKLLGNLALIERETQRCSAIVRNLLDFARERDVVLKPVDLNAVVEEAISLVDHQATLLGMEVEGTLTEIPMVLADFGQVRQAIVNIVMNAFEAMGRGGRVTLATRLSADGTRAEVAIEDTGPGIEPERLQKIFDPFFTTKEKGTGLGLSVVYGIMQRHGGAVDVTSVPGQGTTFTLRLQLAPETSSAGAAEAVAGDVDRG